MIGSLILMFVTDSRLALMMLPVLLATSRGHRVLRLAHGTAVPDRPEETGPAEHGPAGEYCRRAAGQGLCARRARG